MGDRQYLDIATKITLLLVGLADFLGLLPDSLDFLDKLLTIIILGYFWFALKPAKFMFGAKSKWLDTAIIVAYYLLVLNTFFRFLQPFLPFHLFDVVSKNISFVSLYGGSILLFLLTIYVSFFVKLGERSVVYGISNLINKKLFDKIKTKKINKYSIIEFILNYIILYTIAIYFFALVNQWFVVSLDKSLLVVAALFAVKDLEKSKIKALHTIGEFDDKVLSIITELFTKKFYLAFAFLLIFHYLSDLSVFFLHYITDFIPLDPYYALGQSHQSLYALFHTEAFSYSGLLTYLFSGFGAFFLLLIPILILFFIIFNLSLKKLIEKRKLITIIIFISMIAFFLAPWVKQVPITESSAVVGVDFQTQRISDSTFLTFEGIAIISIALFIMLWFTKKLIKELSALAYIGSAFFLGQYVYNFFISSLSYYTVLISEFSGKYFLLFNLYILLFLDFLFYFGTFVLLVYYSSRYIIDNIIKGLISDAFIFVWTLLIITLPYLVMYNFSYNSAITGTIVAATFFISSLAMVKELKGKEHRDEFILSVNAVIFIYHIALLFLLFTNFSYLTNTLIQPVFVLIFSIFLLKFFKIKFAFKIKTKYTSYAILTGIIFGLLFYLIKEPTPIFNAYSLVPIYSLLVAVSEELLFRGIVYRIAKAAFAQRKALMLQAAVFAIIHIITFINQARPASNLLLYIAAAFLFSIAAAKLSDKNITYAIMLHFVTNILTVSFI